MAAPFRCGAAIALFAAAWGALGWPWLSGTVTIPWDAKAHWYPHLLFAARAIHGGASPFWTPAIFAGSPEIADPQSALFSLPLLVLALLDGAPTLAAMDRAIFAMLFAGGLGVILLFREKGWHWGGATLAAIAFAFGGSAAWRLQHLSHVTSLCLWVIAWALLLRALRRSSLVDGALAGLASAFMVLGRDQMALLGCYLLAGAVFWHWLEGGFRTSLKPLIAASLVGAAVVTVPVLLSALWGAESNRVVIDLEGAGRGSLHPAHLISLVVGNLYGAAGDLVNHWGPPSPTWEGTGLFLARNMGALYAGGLTLLLALAALLSGAAFRREALFVTAALAFVLLYALGWYTPAFRLFWHLPGVDLFRRPADAAFAVGGLLAILGGYGAHLLLTGRMTIRWWREGLVAGAGLALAAGLIVAMKAPAPAWTALAIAAVSMAASLALLILAPRPFLPVALAGLLTLDLAVTNAPSESTALPPGSYDVLTPGTANATLAALRPLIVRDSERRDRVELIGLGYPWQNAAMAHGLEDTLGFNPVRSAAYATLVGAEDIAALPDQRRFPPAFPSYRSPLADILGLRFIVTSVPLDLPLKARTPEAYIYENVRALPRVWIAPEAAETPPALVAQGFPPDLDPRRTVLLEGPLPPRRSGGSARILRYENTEIVIETTTGDGGILVLADAWHPWWRAEIGGQPVPVRRAYGLVRAVEVPGGTATVRFTFAPIRGALSQLLTRP